MNIILIIILLVIILILIWALLGGKSDIFNELEDESGEKDKTFRRRSSDKDIEKEYPESAHHPMRRKTDLPEEVSPAEPDKPFKIPYQADEIIPESSRFRIYRRTLLNSEIYAAKGDYSTAISLYEGVRSRIQDVDTRFKIDANIEYLKHYKKKKEGEARRKEEQAKRGVAGERGAPGDENEIMIKLGGMPSQGIRINSLPETINIGVIDPMKSLDMESIVQNVTQKLKGELSDVRDEISRLKGASAGEQIPAGGAQIQPAGASAPRAAVPAVNEGVEAISELKKEFQNLSRTIQDATAARIAEADREPALAQARFDSQKPLLDAQAVKALMDSIPRQKAPEPSSVRAPVGTSAGRMLRKTEAAEDGEDYELLSEYGKDTSGDEMSDDEIFEKILRDEKGKAKDDFEIIGEKKERDDHVTTTTDEMDTRQREDESFYRRLLSTTKRKKKELPILKVSYDFTKLPDDIGLSREKNIIEYAFYKYKPMLEKANEFIKKRKVRNAINYYKVVMSQNIPPEFKSMIRKNLDDLTEYLEKYLSGD